MTLKMNTSLCIGRAGRAPLGNGPALASALVLSMCASAAQADPGGVPGALSDINKTLGSLIATVNALGSKVTELTTAIGTLPVTPAALATSMLSAKVDQRIECRVSNIGTGTAVVTVTPFDPLGTSPPVVVSLAPAGKAGNTQIVRASQIGDTFIYRACQFSSSNTPLGQLRASAVVTGSSSLEIFSVSEAR